MWRDMDCCQLTSRGIGQSTIDAKRIPIVDAIVLCPQRSTITLFVIDSNCFACAAGSRTKEQPMRK
jgi:hypothetical protein